jgi:hypothetical protein
LAWERERDSGRDEMDSNEWARRKVRALVQRLKRLLRDGVLL